MKLKLLSLLAIGPLLAGCAHHHASEPPPRSDYQYPLFSSGQKFGGLPPSVQNTIRAQAGVAELDDIEKVTSPLGEPVYVITFRKSLVYHPLYVAADGSVLNPDFTIARSASAGKIGILTSGPSAGLRLSDLPPDVVRRIQEQAPDAEIAFIAREVWGDRVVFSVTFKDETKHPKLYVAADGSVMAPPAK